MARLLLVVAVLLPLAAAAGELPRPAALEDEVEFWKRVYTEVDTNGGLIHDSRELSVVYEAVEFPDGLNRHQRQKRVDRVKDRYRRILTELVKGDREDLTDEQRRVLELWGEDVSDDTLQAARNRLRFQLGQRDKFRAGLVRSGAWEPHIRETMREMGLPEELAALPHVESSFNPRAYSRVGAAGMWQFTRATGQRYLRIDHVVDERMDPFKATVAAARLLKHNYQILDSWPLAITAYNHGAAGMRRAARSTGTDDIATIVHEYSGRRFGFASRNFYVALLAAAEVDRNAHKYFGGLRRHSPLRTTSVTLPNYIPIDTLEDALGVDRDSLKDLNLALQSSVWSGDKFVPKGYELRVPASDVRSTPQVALASIDPRQRYTSQKPDRFHEVRRGHTLSWIADRYGVSTGELVRVNNLRDRHTIRAGQTLRLPVSDSDASVATVAARGGAGQSREIPDDGVYRVRSGDTLSGIAQRFGISQAKLTRMNSLNDRDALQIGQRLQLEAEQPAEQTVTVAALGYDVQLAGEVLAEQRQARDQTQAQPADGDEVVTAGSDDNAGMPVDAQPQLSADPSDYEVAANATIEIQAAETLGHYAEWLDLRTQRLRDINGLRFGKPVVVGDRLKLQFTEVTRRTFVERRLAYHRKLQGQFFDRFQIAGSEQYTVERGDSLWVLARRRDDVPLWLLRQYNPELDFASLRPGVEVTFPVIEPRPEEASPAGGKGPVQQAALESDESGQR